MEIQISIDQFNELTKRLDQEIQAALCERLASHKEIIMVERRKLSPGVIFAAYSDEYRYEILSAFIPITSKNTEHYRVIFSRVKFICNRYLPESGRRGQFKKDVAYGDAGTETFCLDPMDIDSVQPFVDTLSEYIIKRLSPLFA